MAPFDFRLERILRVREVLTKDRSRVVRDVQDEATRAEEALASLREIRDNPASAPDSTQPLTAGELAAVHGLLSLIDQHIAAGEATQKVINERLEAALRELEKAHGEERAIQILRERAHERWTTEERRREQEASDESARNRRNRDTW